MRDPLFDKAASASNVICEETYSVVNATIEETPTTVPGLDCEIEGILQGPEVEESPFGQYVKDCPVCKSAVRCYFINFNEKVVMCETSTCCWPFGHEELQYLKHEEALTVDEEVESLKVMTYGPIPPSGSYISTAAWSELERGSKGLDSEEPGNTPTHQSDAERDAKLQGVLKQQEAELQTRKNLQDIKKLNVELQKSYEDEDEISCIRNKKWIKHLNNLQSMSGMKLLRKEEMALLNQKKLPQGLTMNIDKENTSITINLAAPSISTLLPTTMQELAPTELTPTEPTAKESIATESTATESTATESTAKESTATEPIVRESTAIEPTAAESTSTEPIVIEVIATEPTVTESTCTEPIVIEVFATEPTATESTSTEPTATEPTATESTSTVPIAIEVVDAEPTATESTCTEPIVIEVFATEPTATESTSTEPTATESTSTEPTATESTSTVPIAIEVIATEPTASDPIAIEVIATESTDTP